jgi:hypothetical protein
MWHSENFGPTQEYNQVADMAHTMEKKIKLLKINYKNI